MKLLADQDIYRITIEWLRKKGHNVVTAKDLGMARAADEELLEKANEMGRLFLTTDIPDLVFGVLRSAPPQIKANAAQKPTFPWWLHALLSGVISQAT
jgi:hypothetical protein